MVSLAIFHFLSQNMRDVYQCKYLSPLGEITMYSDSFFLTSLFFSDSKKREDYPIKDLEIFKETKHFLDEYFKGANPKSFPRYHLEGISIFQSIVLEETCNIE